MVEVGLAAPLPMAPPLCLLVFILVLGVALESLAIEVIDFLLPREKFVD